MSGQEFAYSIEPSHLRDLGIDDPTDGELNNFVSREEMPTIYTEYPPPLPDHMQEMVRQQAARRSPQQTADLDDSLQRHWRNGGKSEAHNRWTRDDHSDYIAMNLGFGDPTDHEVDWSSEGGLNPEFDPDNLSTHEIVANDVLNKWESSPHWDEYGGASAWESPMGHRIERVQRKEYVDPREVRADWDDFQPFGPSDAMFPGNRDNPMFHYEMTGPGRGIEHYDTWDDAADEANWDAGNLADEIAGKTFAVGRHLDDISRERGMRPGTTPDFEMVREAERRARG